MARIRSIKPTIWGDDRFCQLTRDARLLWLGIISNADDAGRFIATPVALSGTIFPLDDIPPATIKRWRAQLVDQGLIVLYKIGPREYGYLPKWTKHQRIDRPQASSLPAPPPNGSPPPDRPTGERIVEPFVESLDEPFEERPSSNSTGDWNGRDRKPLPTANAMGPRDAPHNGEHPNCRACGTNQRRRATNPRALHAIAELPPRYCGQCHETYPVRKGADGRYLDCPTCHPEANTA